MVLVLVVAHLSDTHFGGLPSAAERARRVLAHVAAMRPAVDLVLLTGDVADHGGPEEYAEASAVLAEWPGPAPVLPCPGNHDVRAAYAAWRGRSDSGPVNEAHRVGGHLVVMLDSLVPAPPGERIDHGLLEPETLAWLDDRLGARPPGEPALVCLHHPPVDVGITLMDPIRLVNADQLAAVLDRHDDVRAVLVGHAHTACAATYDGLPLRVAGGIASTVTLDAEQLPPLTDGLGPTFAVHLIDEAGVVTHWRTLAP